MRFADYINIHGKKVNKEAFIHLIQVAGTDKRITQEEYEVLHKEGRRFGLTDPEIDELMKAERNHQYVPPYSLDEKFEHLYQVAQLILADNVVNECEKKMLRKFAIEAGFSDKTTDKLKDLLLEGIKEKRSEEDLLQEFRDKHLFRD